MTPIAGRSKASGVDSHQITEEENASEIAPLEPATKVRLKATKGAGAPYPSGASLVNGHARALLDEDDGYAKVPVAAAVAVLARPDTDDDDAEYF